MTPVDAADSHRYRAFLLSPTRFGESGPPDRRVSASNARAMSAFLGDRLWGVCTFDDIDTMADDPADEVRTRLRDWFSSAAPDEVLVFAYSGRGVGDGDDMRLATATAGESISGTDLIEWMALGDARAAHVLIDADDTHAERLAASAPANVSVMAASDALVAIDHGAGTASSFTSTLIAALTAIREPDDATIARSLAEAPGLARRDVPAPSVIHVPRDRFLVDVPLRRVTPRTPTAAARDGALGWAVVGVLALVVVAAFVAFSGGSSNDEDDAAGGLTTTPDVTAIATLAVDPTPPESAAPAPEPTLAVPASSTRPDEPTDEATSASTSLLPTTVLPTTVLPTLPLDDVLAAADLGIPGSPIGDPPCDGSWVVQIGATNAPASTAAVSIAEVLEAPGTSYTFTPGSCASFDQSAAFYVVYLGPFDSESDAQSACDDYVDTDPGTRQCFARQLG